MKNGLVIVAVLIIVISSVLVFAEDKPKVYTDTDLNKYGGSESSSSSEFIGIRALDECMKIINSLDCNNYQGGVRDTCTTRKNALLKKCGTDANSLQSEEWKEQWKAEDEEIRRKAGIPPPIKVRIVE